jgi:A/G-specific adenine glycosylase
VSRVSFLRRALKAWGRRNLRRFPWRDTSNPYRVLIAELMLRRTRPGQVLPIYETFLKRYPSPQALAGARDADLCRLLAPLGLRWRARNIVAVARQLATVTPAVFHDTTLLRRLPGVGEYVASAVQVMVFERPEVVIDTNVIRVLARYWGLTIHPEARRQRTFRQVAQDCVPRQGAKLYTLALLDLGSSVCITPRPRCNLCPLKPQCVFALQESRAS